MPKTGLLGEKFQYSIFVYATRDKLLVESMSIRVRSTEIERLVKLEQRSCVLAEVSVYSGST